MRRSFRISAGYTLVEMMVIIAIIGVLALILAQAMPFLRERSRDSARIATLANLRRVIELYRTDNGTYPTGASSGNFYYFTDNDAFVSGFSAAPGTISITSAYIPNVTPTYFDVLPVDPQPGASTMPGCDGFDRNWAYFSNGDHYKLVVNCAAESGLIDPNDSYADPGWCFAGGCQAWAISDNMDFTTSNLGWQ